MTGDSPFAIDRISPKAESYLRRLPRQQQKAVAKAFDYLCNVSPFRHPNPTVIKPLRGPRKGQWRYRIGGILAASASSTSWTKKRVPFKSLLLTLGAMCIKNPARVGSPDFELSRTLQRLTNLRSRPNSERSRI